MLLHPKPCFVLFVPDCASGWLLLRYLLGADVVTTLLLRVDFCQALTVMAQNVCSEFARRCVQSSCSLLLSVSACLD